MWFSWRPRFLWKTLCPIYYADPFGLMVVMPRVVQPVPQEQVDAMPDYYPNITSETKHDDFGMLGGNIVAIDYGLPFKDAVRKQRMYYQGFSGIPATEFPR